MGFGGRSGRRLASRAGAALAGLLLLAALPTGCGGSDKKPKQREIILSTEAVDEKVGKDVATQVRDEMGLVEDPVLSGYVNQIGQRLARYAPRGRFRYSFKIVDQSAPNAFALPGGFIYVSRGLLTLANSEDELACVLGHEIIHVVARHAAERQAMIKSMPGPFQFFAAGYIARNGRDQERESDRLGQSLAGLAGYDPMGMADFMRDLERTERLAFGASRLPGWLDTHPATTERVSSAASRAHIIQWKRKPGISADHADFLSRMEGVVVGGSASQGVVQGARFLHPDLDISLLFPNGWQVINTPAAVGAVPRTRDAQVFLQHQGLGLDPKASADEYIEEEAYPQGFRADEVSRVQIGDLDGWRVQGRVGMIKVMFTWISYNSQIYRITGVALSSKYDPAFISVARSFRPLTPEQRASIRELHLMIVKAYDGETLSDLSRRSANAWNVQQTAVMNNVFANQGLKSGQLIKVAVERQYPPEDGAR